MSDDTATITTDAVVRMQAILNLSDADVGEILGLSRSSVRRRKKQRALVHEGEQSWEDALQLIRIYRSLSELLGDNDETLQYWLMSENAALGGRPIDLIKTAEGRVKTEQYLNAMKEKI